MGAWSKAFIDHRRLYTSTLTWRNSPGINARYRKIEPRGYATISWQISPFFPAFPSKTAAYRKFARNPPQLIFRLRTTHFFSLWRILKLLSTLPRSFETYGRTYNIFPTRDIKIKNETLYIRSYNRIFQLFFFPTDHETVLNVENTQESFLQNPFPPSPPLLSSHHLVSDDKVETQQNSSSPNLRDRDKFQGRDFLPV